MASLNALTGAVNELAEHVRERKGAKDQAGVVSF
jgi:hypothetical protein